MQKSQVFFTDFRTIAFGDGLPTKLKKLMKKAGIGNIDMDGKFVAIKMHFGEAGNISFLRPNYARAVGDVVKELGGLMEQHGFVGVEPVALPAGLFKSINPFRWIYCGLQFAFREFCARLPGGYKLFRWAERGFSASVNNAVIGAEPGNETIRKAFQFIKEMPETERLKRYRLGTRLLQNVTRNKSSDSMLVLPAKYFYPLGPEISAHWFKAKTSNKLESLLQKETCVVHWYNSVEGRFLKTKVSAEWVKKNPTTAFSALANEVVNQNKN